MASLSIRIVGFGSSFERAAGVVAELDRLDRRNDRTRERRKVSVGSASERIVENLPAGDWEVRIVFASGEVMTREVTLVDGGRAVATFEFAREGGERRPPSTAGPGRATKSAVRRAVGPPGGSMQSALRSALSDRFLGGGATGRDAEPTVELHCGRTNVGEDDDAVRRWWLTAATSLVEGEIRSIAPLPNQPTKLPLIVEDGVSRWRLPVMRHMRSWATFQDGDVRRLHAVPSPWRVGDARSAATLVLVDGGAAASGVRIEDDAYAGLLDYLASGSVVDATEFLRVEPSLAAFTLGSTEMLVGDGVSPLGACAAAYALLGSTVTGVRRPWNGMVEALDERFGWLPDGAILRARQTLMLATTDVDVAAAGPIVRRALRRGIPFYRQGFDWLLQAMSDLDDDLSIRAVRPAVAAIAAALDMTEAFTTFRTAGGG